MTKINICVVPFLDLNYSNVIDFETLESRDNYFKSKTIKTYESNIKYDNERTSVVINEPIENTRQFDYLFFYDVKGKAWFYFITNNEQVTVGQTRLHLQLDVWTSYLKMYDILPSFVDRCHVPRWIGNKPTYNMEDEGIEIGEYIQKSSETICSMENSIIVTSSVPIGKVYSPNSGTGGSGTTARGKISSKGFRFIKGYEGFAPYGAYLSGESFRTVGYGSTEKWNLDYYDKHKPFPCSEQLASEIFMERVNSEFSEGLYKKLQDNGIENDVTSNMFDAMVSLCYNCGLSGFLNKPGTPWNLIKSNPKNPSIRDVWKSFATSGESGELEGLRLRRISETNVYFDNEYEMRTIIKYNESGKVSGTVTENNGDGYLPPSLSEDGANITELQANILNSGRKLIGIPYVWGGNYPPLGSSSGTDCSGFCQWAYNDNGKGNLIPGRWTTETIANHGVGVSKNEIQVCDLILTPGHVVMYSGFRNNKHYILEAPRTGLNIREREYTFPSNILGIRRLL